MQNVLRGRVIDMGQENDQSFIVILTRDKYQTLLVGDSSNVTRGDLVEISNRGAVKVLVRPSSPWDALGDTMRWRRVTSGPTRMERLWLRQKIMSAIRSNLYQQDFLEVETPLLVKGTCPDTHIDSVGADGGYLVTSTEYQIKRLIVGGFENVFTLTKNFRLGDRGRYHSSEFTMLEWARAFGSLDEIEDDAVRFIRDAFTVIYPGKTHLQFQDTSISIMGEPWEELTVREALHRYLGLENVEDFSLEILLNSAHNAGVHIPKTFEQDRYLLLSHLLELVQPHLGKQTPTFLREWPAFMTSSAQVSQSDPHVAKRSELYIAGIEIADGFPFLTDAHQQQVFFDREFQRRSIEGKELVIIDHRYIDALGQGISPGAGMALGVDRLVMVLTNAAQLSDVQAFSWDEL